MVDGRTPYRPQTDHQTGLAQTRPATNCQGAASLQVDVPVRFCLPKQWSNLLVAAADSLDCCLYAGARRVRSRSRRRAGQAGLGGTRSSWLARQRAGCESRRAASAVSPAVFARITASRAFVGTD